MSIPKGSRLAAFKGHLAAILVELLAVGGIFGESECEQRIAESCSHNQSFWNR